MLFHQSLQWNDIFFRALSRLLKLLTMLVNFKRKPIMHVSQYKCYLRKGKLSVSKIEVWFDIDYYKLHRLSFFSQYLGVLRSWRWFVPNVCPVKNRKFRVIFFQAWIFFTFENSYDKRFLSRRFQSEYVTKSELLLGTR